MAVSYAPFADLADSAPHLFKDPIGDVEARCPPAAGIFCYTMAAAERLTAVKCLAKSGCRVRCPHAERVAGQALTIMLWLVQKLPRPPSDKQHDRRYEA